MPIWGVRDAPKVKYRPDLKLLPYAYLGYDPDRGHLVNGGLDFKTELPGRISAVGTINPDFRNIEQSVLPLSFSRFELLADETRPFFLEGSEYVMSDIFASQRIGDFDFGLNVNGALSSKTSFGLLNTFDFGRTFASVGKLSHRFSDKLGMRTSITALETPDTHNHAGSTAISYSDGPFYLGAAAGRTWDSMQGKGDQWTLETGYSTERMYASVFYSSVQQSYSPGLGYTPEVDYKGPSYFVYYNQPLKGGPVEEWSINAGYSDLQR